MFGGMGNMGNMAGMMKKVQKMQSEMKKMQDELKRKTVDGTAGGGGIRAGYADYGVPELPVCARIGNPAARAGISDSLVSAHADGIA